MSDLTPISRKEHFLSRAAGGPGLELEPKTRVEHFLQKIIDAGGSGPGPSITVDTQLNINSTNPVQNKTIALLASQLAEELDEKADKATTVTVEGTTPTITPVANTIYNCGTLDSLTITNPPAQGAYSIVFTSGSTATTTTIPSTILGLEDFAAEANTLYEINVLDNRAVVGSWEVTV